MKPKSHKWKVQHSSESTEWGTPPKLFGMLNDEFGFTVDVAASKKNAKCSKFFTKKKSALEMDDGAWFEAASGIKDKRAPPGFWECSSIWLNPPYGRGVDQWLMRAWRESQHGCVVVCLVFACTDTKWWKECVWKLADEIRLITGRVRFIDPATGKLSNAAPKGSAVIVYRPGRRVQKPAVSQIDNPAQEMK